MSSTILLALALVASVHSHMSVYMPSMWGQERDNINSNWAVNPLQDLSFSDWWFHGPKSVNDPPDANAITQLPTGGTIDLEIATNKAFTGMGRGLWHSAGKTSRVPPDPWANTGSEWPSNLHSPKRSDVAGCALGIAYKSKMTDVQPEDFVIFSVVHDCPARALQAFDIPYLPPCPNNLCMCSWFWIHNSIGGTDQMYMTPFQCNVQTAANIPVSKRVIGKPQVPVRCDGAPPCYLFPSWGNSTKTCNKVAQYPMYWANNQKNNMPNPTNAQCAPIYNDQYGYVEGAQHQMFSDSFKCNAGTVLGDTLYSNTNNTLSSSPATVLASPSCTTKLAVQGDGNVVYSDVSSGKVYWTSNTAGQGTGPYRLVAQNDGNVVLYDSKSTSLWTSKTAGTGCAPYRLQIRDPMKLTLVDCNFEPIKVIEPML